jgi:hypothetical protein
MTPPTVLSVPVFGPGRVVIAITIEPSHVGPFTLVASPASLAFPVGDDGPKSVTLSWVDGTGATLPDTPVVTDVVVSDPAVVQATASGNVIDIAVLARPTAAPVQVDVTVSA